jgi:hypothetical protein
MINRYIHHIYLSIDHIRLSIMSIYHFHACDRINQSINNYYFTERRMLCFFSPSLITLISCISYQAIVLNTLFEYIYYQNYQDHNHHHHKNDHDHHHHHHYHHYHHDHHNHLPPHRQYHHHHKHNLVTLFGLRSHHLILQQ